MSDRSDEVIRRIRYADRPAELGFRSTQHNLSEVQCRVPKPHETPAKAGIPPKRHNPHYATLPINPCKSE